MDNLQAPARRAVVTGGESGLGAACEQRLRADGLEVLSLDVRGEPDLRVDVRDPVEVARAVDLAGQVDILVNSAGVVGPNCPLWGVEEQDWASTFDVNVAGTFRMLKAVLPGMRDRGWGRVVNIASIAGKDGNPRLSAYSAYSASKAAVITMTKSVGEERIVQLIPMQRLGRPEEVAGLVSWLVSEECSFSGSVHDISGGRATTEQGVGLLRGCSSRTGPRLPARRARQHCAAA